MGKVALLKLPFPYPLRSVPASASHKETFGATMVAPCVPAVDPLKTSPHRHFNTSLRRVSSEDVPTCHISGLESCEAQSYLDSVLSMAPLLLPGREQKKERLVFGDNGVPHASMTKCHWKRPRCMFDRESGTSLLAASMLTSY
jgi:hypothetical protein